MNVDEERVTQAADASSVADAEATTPAPAESKPEAAVTPSADLSALKAEIAELKGRLNVPDAQAIAEAVLRDPRLKQSQRDMISAQLRQQREQAIEERTALIDDLETEGTIDSVTAETKRRAIRKAVKQEFDQRAQELAQRESTEPPPPTPVPTAPDYQRKQQALQVAQGWLAKYGLEWKDMPEFDSGNTLPPDFTQFLNVVVERAAEKKVKQAEVEWQKKRDQQVKTVREADAAGGTKAPPEGSVAEKQIKRTLADADGIGAAIDAAFLAKRRQRQGK